MKGFSAYIDYLMIKRHFDLDDFVWKEDANYGRVKPETFQKRRDASFFIKLDNDSSGVRRRWVDRIVSGFVYDRNFWIGSVFDDEYIDYHHFRMKRFGSLESTFSREADDLEHYLITEETCLKTVLLTRGTNDPIIIDRFMRPTSLETFAVLENFSSFTRMWFPINPLQQMRRSLIYKYSMLLRLGERDLVKMKERYHQLSVILAPSAPTHFLGESL